MLKKFLFFCNIICLIYKNQLNTFSQNLILEQKQYFCYFQFEIFIIMLRISFENLSDLLKINQHRIINTKNH